MPEKLYTSIKHAVHGVFIVASTQRNFRVQIAYAILAIVLGFVFAVSLTEWFILSLGIVVVFTAEMANTATEYLCNLIYRKKDIEVQYIKDIAAGIVLVSAIWAMTIGVFIFLPKLLVLLLPL